MPTPPTYGGQAVIEGVMMRGPEQMAVAVRHPDGSIVLHSEPLTAGIYRAGWAKLPFVRGLALLWDALGLGSRALMWSAAIAEEPAEKSADGGEARATPRFEHAAQWGTLAVSLVLAIGLFFVLPLALTGLAERFLEPRLASAGQLHVVGNLIEGVIRLLFLLAYIVLIGQMAEIKRVFAYHGAEHKTIHAYEAGVPLTPENVRPFSLLHPRCGTGFLLIVMVISIFVFVLLGPLPFALRVLSRILLIPVIAGLAYEVIKWSAPRIGNPVVRTILAPSLALQRLTTREPDDGMIEVAIRALQCVLAEEPAAAPDERAERAEGEPALA